MRREIAALVARMERKLESNQHKTGWKHLRKSILLSMLRREVTELEEALLDGGIIDECADIANFAMMIADVSGGEVPHDTNS